MAGASTGGLDQNASMRCTEGHALLLDCRPELTPLENVSQQEFDLDEYNLELLVDTQAPHQLNDGQYAQRRATCEEAAKILGVANLRVTADGISKADDPFQALKETLDALPDETMKKRVRHVVTEISACVPSCVPSLRATSRLRAVCSTLPTIRWPRTTRSPCPSSTWPWTWPARTAPTVRV